MFFASTFSADFFSTFFASTFSADFFSFFLFAVGLSFGEGEPRDSPDVFVDALATIFSPGFLSVPLRGLVATCGRGGGFVFAVTGGGAGPVAVTVSNMTGLSVGVVLGAGGAGA